MTRSRERGVDASKMLRDFAGLTLLICGRARSQMKNVIHVVVRAKIGCDAGHLELMSLWTTSSLQVVGE
ncbi:MAG: hypothetical protein O6946_07020 [Gammaproteobacteria bacterium]|nr:hypothetical protein [Gammaproteobacteria bacterium]MCZ6827338.1 hypothetical protein [Gammaproteobacteria bacterium]